MNKKSSGEVCGGVAVAADSRFLSNTVSRGLKSMSKTCDPKRKPAWTAEFVPCEDRGHLLEYDFWRPGLNPSVCRRCQNMRYEAKTKGTPEDKRGWKRRTLLAKHRRVETRLARDD